MTTGDKIKKSVIYILLVCLRRACLVPVSSDDGQRDQGAVWRLHIPLR